MFDIHEANVTVHQEATVHLNRILKTIRDLGAKPAVAVNQPPRFIPSVH